MIEVQPKTRDIPVWLTGVVLILCVLGGGWLIRWYTRDAGTQTVDVPLESPAAARRRQVPRAARRLRPRRQRPSAARRRARP